VRFALAPGDLVLVLTCHRGGHARKL